MNYDTIAQIKQWRIKHGVSQRQLATKAGFNRNTYAAWENQRRTPSRKVIWRLQNIIFAWGENDYITDHATILNEMENNHQQTLPKTKKSMLYRLGAACGRVVRWIIKGIKR